MAVLATVTSTSGQSNETRQWSCDKAYYTEMAYWNLSDLDVYNTFVFGHIILATLTHKSNTYNSSTFFMSHNRLSSMEKRNRIR